MSQIIYLVIEPYTGEIVQRFTDYETAAQYVKGTSYIIERDVC